MPEHLGEISLSSLIKLSFIIDLENDLTHLFNAIPDILCLLSLEGEFLKINKAGCDLLGYQEQEIIGQHFTQFMRNDDRIKISDKLQELKAGQTTFEFENRFITKSGGIIWLSWFGNASFSEELLYATGKNSTTEKNLKEGWKRV
jgi:PAS domain S-box-containing protein